MASEGSPGPLPPLTPPPPKAGSSQPPPHLPPAPAIPSSPAKAEALQARGQFSPDEAIDEQIESLEKWVSTVAKTEKAYVVRFWVLRGLAFVAAAGAAAFGAMGNRHLVIGLGALAALCIAIDSAWPSAVGRNPLRRAVHDLRELQNTIKLKWDKIRLAHPAGDDKARTVHALSLLDELQAGREEIGRYLGGAEASPTAAKDTQTL